METQDQSQSDKNNSLAIPIGATCLLAVFRIKVKKVSALCSKAQRTKAETVQDKQVEPQKSESIDQAHRKVKALTKLISLRFEDACTQGMEQRDDHISSQRSRKLDDRFSSNQVYDDCEESIEPRENPQPIPCESQKHCKDHELIVSAHHENESKQRRSAQHLCSWNMELEVPEENNFKTPKK
ncbi:hypothetical protein YC2023_018927 [Brassica napus]